MEYWSGAVLGGLGMISHFVRDDSDQCSVISTVREKSFCDGFRTQHSIAPILHHSNSSSLHWSILQARDLT